MASEERRSMIFYSESSYEENISMSPNGPLSDLYYGSSYSSTSGSEIGSPETIENEDEVLLAELTRRMAEFTFEDDDEDVLCRKAELKGVYNNNSRSSGYDCNQGIKSASKQPTIDTGLARNPSPRQTYPKGNESKAKKEGAESGGRRGMTVEHHRNSKTQDMMKSRRSSVQGGGATLSNVPLTGSGSGLRAVFLGGSNNNSFSNGTGVFIPSATLSKGHPKKKTGCSTVLIPARVLQTLQQHFNNVDAKSQSQKPSDVLARINGLLSQQQEQAVFHIQPPETTVDKVELGLPHEWTY